MKIHRKSKIELKRNISLSEMVFSFRTNAFNEYLTVFVKPFEILQKNTEVKYMWLLNIPVLMKD